MSPFTWCLLLFGKAVLFGLVHERVFHLGKITLKLSIKVFIRECCMVQFKNCALVKSRRF